VDYVLLGEKAGFVNGINGDIDIAVDKKSLENIENILNTFCKEHKGQIIQCLQHEIICFYYIVAFFHDDGSILFLRLDFSSDYCKHCRRYLTFFQLLENKTKCHHNVDIQYQYYVPDNCIEFLYYFIKKVEKGSIEPEQCEYLNMLLIQNEQKISGLLNPIFEEQVTTEIIKIISTLNTEAFLIQIPRFKKKLHKYFQIDVKDRISEMLRILKRISRPNGYQIVFLGADGSGKSSVIKEVERTMACAFRGVERFHLRPKIIKSNSTQVTTSPYEKPARSVLMSSIKLLILFVDYWLGHVKLILPKRLRSYLIIFDRYFDDLLIDPKRYRFSGPMLLAKFIKLILPKPDLYIVLTTSAQIVQARKQEVSFHESEIQIKAYEEFSNTTSNAHLIDASQDINHVVQDVCKILLSKLAERRQ